MQHRESLPFPVAHHPSATVDVEHDPAGLALGETGRTVDVEPLTLEVAERDVAHDVDPAFVEVERAPQGARVGPPLADLRRRLGVTGRREGVGEHPPGPVGHRPHPHQAGPRQHHRDQPDPARRFVEGPRPDQYPGDQDLEQQVEQRQLADEPSGHHHQR